MASIAFRKAQLGREQVRGTSVVADERVNGNFTLTSEKTFDLPVDNRGSLAEHFRSSTVAQRGSWNIESSVTYEQLIHWLAMSLKGGVEPASVTFDAAKHDNNSVFANLPLAIDDTSAEESFVDFTAADDKIYVGRTAGVFRGCKFTMGTVKNAALTKITTVEVSDGASGWIAATLVKDKTLNPAGTAWGTRDGIVEFTVPTAWASDTVDSVAAFWVRFTWDVNWTANVDINEFDYVPIDAIWTYTPNLTSVNVQDSYSIEWGDDDQAWQSLFCLMESLELGWGLNAPVTMRSSLFSRFPTKVTFTSGLSNPQSLTGIASNDAKVFIDGAYADLGTTQKATLVVGGVIRLPATGVTPIKTADGTQEFSTIIEARRHLEIELELLLGTDAITEYDAFVAETLRAIRIEFTGPSIVSGTTHKLTIDAIGKYTSSPELFGERDGANIFRLTFSSFEDTLGNEMSFVLQTARAAAQSLKMCCCQLRIRMGSHRDLILNE